MSDIRAALILLAAAPATACPTADDLDAGIRLAWDDDTSSVFTATGTTVAERNDDGDFAYVYESHRGLIETAYYELTNGTLDPASRADFTYTFDLDAVFPLTEGGVVGGIQTGDETAGDDTVVPFSVQVGASGEVTIGACTYAMTDVLTTYVADGAPSLIRYVYLDDLGFGYVVSYTDWYDHEVYSAYAIDAVR